MPYWEAVRPTRRAISPRLAIRIDRNGSGLEALLDVVVEFHLAPLRERMAAVARSQDAVRMVSGLGTHYSQD